MSHDPMTSLSTRTDGAGTSYDAMPNRRSTVGCIVPAYNEAMSIAGVLDSMLSQTRRPDAIHVIVNNTTDDTAQIAAWYAGAHEMVVNGERIITEIHVHDLAPWTTRRSGRSTTASGSLTGWTTCSASTATPPRTPGRSSTSSPRWSPIARSAASRDLQHRRHRHRRLMAKFLICGQRAQFSAFNMRNLLNDRQMAVLGGQLSIFSMERCTPSWRRATRSSRG